MALGAFEGVENVILQQEVLWEQIKLPLRIGSLG